MIISKTPLRISFVGGGTDIDAYYKTGYGAVVSATIDKYIYVTVHKRLDPSIRVGYTKTEIVDRVEDLKHEIVRACLQMAGIQNGIEITTIGEVPAGTGLGSSSSLTVGLLNALYAYKGITLSPQELFEMACKVEIDILDQPIGKQDQAAAAFGGLNYIRFNADESVTHERLWLTEAEFISLERKLMMFYTGVQRNAGAILIEQKKNTSKRLDALDYMRNQADELRLIAKQQGAFNSRFAKMLHEGWQRKRSISEHISNDFINALYDRAINAGAMGGKLLGAGGGGFLLLCCEEGKQQALRDALGLQELSFHLGNYGSRIVYFG